jgi:hypothetical protein
MIPLMDMEYIDMPGSAVHIATTTFGQWLCNDKMAVGNSFEIICLRTPILSNNVHVFAAVIPQ